MTLKEAIEGLDILNNREKTELTEAETVDRAYPGQHDLIGPNVLLPGSMESSEDLSNYVILFKKLLHEVEALHYKLDYKIRETFRDSIKYAHIQSADLLIAKHGHERIFWAFNQALYKQAKVG
jgi:hypothetical protein